MSRGKNQRKANAAAIAAAGGKPPRPKGRMGMPNRKKAPRPEDHMMSGGLGPEPVEVAAGLDEDEDEEEGEEIVDLATLLESDSDSGSEDEEEAEEEEDEDDEDDEDIEEAAAATVLMNGGAVQPLAALDGEEEAEEEDEDEEEDEEDIPLSDIESVASEDRGDIVPHQRLTINNTTALLAAHKRIALPLSSLPFSTHQSITTAEPISIKDVDDDLQRELAFYKQSLDAVTQARQLLKKEGTGFSRPTDYFAEMVKSEEHMGRVRQKLVDAAAGKKASADAKRQRDLKKFGKQIQIAKLQERDKSKRETLEKINSLKRKRGNTAIDKETEPDMFDIALDDTDNKPSKRRDGAPADKRLKSSHKRAGKDAKFGFGGKKRHAKSNDAQSSADMAGFMKGRMKGTNGRPGGAKSAAKARPGKARRAKGRL